MSEATKLKIRFGTREDVPLILQFIVELAEYEKEPRSSVKIDESVLLKDGFDSPSPLFKTFICELEGVGPIGFALYYTAYSTWEGKVSYLEDIFVRPNYRGMGAGKMLFRRVVEEAHNQNMARLVFQVLDWNKPSRDFYESLGAIPHTSWITYRLYKDQLVALLSKP